MNPATKKKKEVKISTIIYAALALAVAYLAVIGALIYFFNVNNGITQKTSRIVPYPAATFGKKYIAIAEVENKLSAVRQFYENQDFSDLGLRVDFSTPDGKKRLLIKKKEVLGKLIENKIIETEAQKRGIKITADVVDQEVSRKLKEYGSEKQTRENLAKLYGWTLEDFKANIVRPDMYREKLYASVKEDDNSYDQAKKKIETAAEELTREKDFTRIVEKYSEGESAKAGGELGWFSYDQMLPEIASSVFTLDKGKISGVIESPLGYHIVKVEDKKKENDIEMVRISQVFIRTKTFGDWLADWEKSYNVKVWLKGLYWNKDSGAVEFSDEGMRKFEDNLRQNSPDDVSVMF